MVETQAGAPVGAASHIIKRPRLTKILDETEARIILLCAPAGYGKTTLAREWVATRSEPVLWYSGGPAMADVAALAVDLAELLLPDPDPLERVRVMTVRGQPPRALAAAIAKSAVDSDAMLVLDDFQYALTHKSADLLIQELVSLLPLRLLITTRERPAWLAGRAAVYGRVKVLTQRELAFTDDEAAAVLPSATEIRHHAQGWPAVLGLAAFAGAVDVSRSGGPADIYEFLAEEIVGALDSEMTTASLLLAAGADEAPDVARELLGSGWSSVIDRALAKGLVTHRPDGWISMHPLLRHFLIQRLSELPDAERRELLDAVLGALRRHKQWDACLVLLTAFPNAQRAASVLRDGLVELLDSGRITTLEEWTNLGRDLAANDPIFTLAHAELALRRGDDVAAVALAEDAAAWLHGDFAARAHVAAARAAHQLEDVDRVLKNANAGERLARDVSLKTEAVWLTVAAAYERHPEQMQNALDRLKALPGHSMERAVRVAAAETFIAFGLRGNFGQALAAAERGVALATHVRNPLSLTNALNVRAQVLKVCGRYAEALAAVPELLTEAESVGLGFVVHHALVLKAASLVGLRSLNEARRTLRDLERLGEPLSAHVQRNVAMTKARLRIASGDLEGAEIELNRDLPSSALLQSELIALRALVAAARGDTARANALMQTAETFSYAEPESIMTTTQLIIAAQAGEADDKFVADRLRGLIEISAIDVIVTACRAYPPIAAHGVAGGLRTELETVFSASMDRDLGRRAGLAMPREHMRGLALSPREREVLELLVAGRTNADIARILFISQSTTKVHVKHIFEKLGVHSRAEAVAAAADWL